MSDLTLPLIGLTTLAGYFFSNNEKNPRQVEGQRQRVEEFEKPNGNNIYQSKKYEEVNREILSRSLQNYRDAENPAKTGILPPLYNTYGVVGSESIMAPEVNGTILQANSTQMSDINEVNRRKDLNKSVVDINARPMFNSSFTYVGSERQNAFTETSDINLDKQTSLLTGLQLDTSHNNMVPFFGSNVRQNVETFTNESLLDRHTANSTSFKHKHEVGKMFAQMPQDINGTPIYTSNVDVDRFLPSMYRQSEKPFIEERIQAPKAGTYDNLIQPTFKNVDDLRVSNKQKMTYEGRSVSGQFGSVRGVQGEQHKRGPATFYEKGQGHLFRTNGEFTAPKLKEDYTTNFKDTSRTSYNLSYIGSASSTNPKDRQRFQMQNRNDDSISSLVQEPKRTNFEHDYSRNVSGQKYVNDYGRSTLSSYETERATSGVQSHLLNVSKKEVGGLMRHSDKARNTMKETTLDADNTRNIKTSFDRGAINAFEAGISGIDAKTTHKETTIMNNYKGMANREDGMGYIVTKYDAKTTGKEILTNNSEHSGNISNVIKNSQVYDTYQNPEKVRNAVHVHYKGGSENVNKTAMVYSTYENPEKVRNAVHVQHIGGGESVNKNATVYTTYDNPEKVRNAIHVQYQGNANTNSQSTNRTNFANAEIRDNKEVLLSGERPSGPQNFQIASGKGSLGEVKYTDNMLLKEEFDSRDIMNAQLPQVILSKDMIGNKTKYREDDQREDTVFADRLQPDLVINQHNQNPYSLRKRNM